LTGISSIEPNQQSSSATIPPPPYDNSHHREYDEAVTADPDATLEDLLAYYERLCRQGEEEEEALAVQLKEMEDAYGELTHQRGKVEQKVDVTNVFATTTTTITTTTTSSSSSSFSSSSFSFVTHPKQLPSTCFPYSFAHCLLQDIDIERLQERVIQLNISLLDQKWDNLNLQGEIEKLMIERLQDRRKLETLRSLSADNHRHGSKKKVIPVTLLPHASQFIMMGFKHHLQTVCVATI